jgi:hypothetical protein
MIVGVDASCATAAAAAADIALANPGDDGEWTFSSAMTSSIGEDRAAAAAASVARARKSPLRHFTRFGDGVPRAGVDESTPATSPLSLHVDNILSFVDNVATAVSRHPKENIDDDGLSSTPVTESCLWWSCPRHPSFPPIVRQSNVNAISAAGTTARCTTASGSGAATAVGPFDVVVVDAAAAAAAASDP